MPLEGGGLPGICGGERSVTQAAGEVEQEDELGGGEEDGRVGDEVVEGEGVGEKRSGRAESAVCSGDAGELGVLARFAGEAGEVHGEEDCVGSDEGGPEVEAAERL